jgi:hypothetical protein
LAVVAQTEVVSTAESQPVEDPQTSRFTWTIENFTRFNGKKHYSEVFVVGGFKWLAPDPFHGSACRNHGGFFLSLPPLFFRVPITSTNLHAGVC